MKYNIVKRNIYTLPLVFVGVCSFGQVGIGTLNPKGVLHVESNTMGIVLPKVQDTLSVITPDGGPVEEATLVYDLSAKCAKFRRADKWSDCLLDDAGAKHEVSDVLNIGTEFKVRKASAGYEHTLLIGQDDNALYVAGDNGDAKTGLGRTVGNTGSFLLNFASPLADASAGYLHSIVATESGEVWTWGYNGDYRTGLGTKTGDTGLPTRVDGFGAGEVFGKAVKVQAGSQNSFVLTENGVVYGVGAATSSTNAGPGTGGAASFFTEIHIPGTVTDISASQYTVAALTSDGKVYVWGVGKAGRLGTGSTSNVTTPTRINFPGGALVKHVTMGWDNGAAISVDGKNVYRWGAGNSIGNLGVNALSPYSTNIPGFGDNGDEVTALAAQRFDYGAGNLFIFTNKGVYVTGENRQGQLGIGNTSTVTGPSVPLSTIGVYSGTVFTGGSIGRQHTILITGENAGNANLDYVAYGMGSVSHRQLGAITKQRRTPTVLTK
ncbi:RCC1 domain-containing protein [Chryseobacterium sp. CT-SW4]|uniref:RCC1 domain-containing protein n=1 Tax=Chryseobacterium sp. SW-1 TaxID=3157343 RepID=UPI003B025BBA